jgi:hypothetical protein
MNFNTRLRKYPGSSGAFRTSFGMAWHFLQDCAAPAPGLVQERSRLDPLPAKAIPKPSGSDPETGAASSRRICEAIPKDV